MKEINDDKERFWKRLINQKVLKCWPTEQDKAL